MQRLVSLLVGTGFAALVFLIAAFGAVSLFRLLEDADRALAQPNGAPLADATSTDPASDVPGPVIAGPGNDDFSVSVGVADDQPAVGAAEAGLAGVEVNTGSGQPVPELVWSVMALPDGEPLAVRVKPTPDSRSIEELDVPSRGLQMTGSQEWVDGEMWRELKLESGRRGWVPARHVTGQPKDWNIERHGDELLDETRRLWALLSSTNQSVDYPRADQLIDRDDPPVPISESSTRAVPVPRIASAGVWFGGIGIMGDIPTPMIHLDAGPLRDRNGWLDRHDFSPDPQTAEFCGGACLASPSRFLDLPEWDRPGVRLILDDLDRATSKTHGHVTSMQAMHSVTIDVPASNSANLDWQRIHVFFDFSEGQPTIVGLYSWGWVP